MALGVLIQALFKIGTDRANNDASVPWRLSSCDSFVHSIFMRRSKMAGSRTSSIIMQKKKKKKSVQHLELNVLHCVLAFGFDSAFVPLACKENSMAKETAEVFAGDICATPAPNERRTLLRAKAIK